MVLPVVELESAVANESVTPCTVFDPEEAAAGLSVCPVALFCAFVPISDAYPFCPFEVLPVLPEAAPEEDTALSTPDRSSEPVASSLPA